jgi:hypothetical protein
MRRFWLGAVTAVAVMAAGTQAAPELPPDAPGLATEQDQAAPVQMVVDAPARPEFDQPPVEMVVDPAPEPVPALKYDFVYNALDIQPGDAGPVYAEALALLTQTQPEEAEEDRLLEWLNMPAADIPLVEAKDYLERFEHALDHVERATRCERCVQKPWRKEDPSELPMPHLKAYKKLGRLLALKAKIRIAEGDYEGACATLRTGYVMVQQMTEERVPISGLVGIAIAGTLNFATEELMRSPDAPNLYWALSGLPSPLVDLRTTLSHERNSIFVLLPALRTPEKSLVTPAQWADMFASLFKMGGEYLPEANAFRALTGQPGVTAWLMRMCPDARAYVIAQGRKVEEVEKMPLAVVCGIYVGATTQRYCDNVGKWYRLPYAEGHDGLRAVEQDIPRSTTEPVSAIAAMTTPVLMRAYEIQALLDCKVAALRCVEAIRMYAAAHDGELPETLDAIKCVPVPPDPVTGRPFTYELEGRTATLSAALIRPGRWHTGTDVNYKITIRE